MKNFTLSVLFLFAMLNISFAQEKEKRQEVGINFTSLNNFGVTYKVGTSKNLWRFNILAINFNNSKDEETNIQQQVHENYNRGAGISIGKEFRKVITKNLEFRYGFDVAFNYNWYKNINKNNNDYYESERTIYTPSLIGVIGANYVFSENLAFGVELLPRFSYRTGKNRIVNGGVETKGDISGFGFNLNNDVARLSLSYRF
ncbi:hypothetical protein [Tenacibaculum ovolyticum]|uniref:hypothetical protein n=2 Tax=Tenacibaculum ovolyticum TaxID=104270 RepID=UPI0007ED90D8|nr:hypothetical protein [Tenacibaculum ovolyticum]